MKTLFSENNMRLIFIVLSDKYTLLRKIKK